MSGESGFWAHVRRFLDLTREHRGYELHDGTMTDGFQRVPISAEMRQQYANYSVVSFIYARIADIEDSDPDGARACRQVVDDCCDHVDVTPGGYPPGSRYLLGAPNDIRALKRLAQNWADHADYQAEWSAA